MAEKRVVFEGSPQDVIWKSSVTELTPDAKIYSRKDCDILFIGRSKYLYVTTVAPNILKALPMEKHRPETNHGMFAYLIKTSSIPKLLKIMYPIPVYYQHIDWKLRAYYSKGINAYYLEKPLVMHNYKIESIREQGLSRQRYQQR